MVSPLCLRCLKRSLRSIDAPADAQLLRRAAFSTTSIAAAGKVVPKGAQKGRTLRLSKNKRNTAGRPPAPGERKAVRKRIVLSNTNALPVEGLQDLTVDKLETLKSFQGQVLGLGNETVDTLRALHAFKPTQGWSLFRRPSSLVRKETVDLAKDLAIVGGKSKDYTRKVIFGGPDSGKSVLLLQAQAMASLKGHIIVHYPEALDLINAQTSYQPLNTPNGLMYIQPHYTAKLLSNIASANRAILSNLQLSQEHQLSIPVQPNMSLARFAEMGAQDPELAWPIWQALWSELTAPSKKENGLQRPPIFVSMDGVDQAMRMSAYLDSETRPIHSHDLVLVKHFMDLLSGQTALPNGGIVLASTCGSNRASSPTLDYHLNHAYVSQHNAGIKEENASSRLPVPEWQPYTPRDSKVDSAMKDVGVIKLAGLSKDEARGVMEYYAQSGMLRGTITPGLVSERWTLAGSGIIGELEKGAVRLRF